MEKEDQFYMSEEEKQKLLQISEISINLSSYEDIFSDFDPRTYSQKALSDDFLLEIKKACKVRTSGNIEVKFLIPASQKKSEHESIIKKRLREYFKKHHDLMHKEVKRIRKKGFVFVSIGSILLLAVTYLSLSPWMDSPSELIKFFMHLLKIAMDPAGWFLIWVGLEKIILTGEEKHDEIDFYDKMSRAEFHFIAY